jgi:hypothetical protein
MDGNSVMLDEMNENWKRRIVEDCEHMHNAIEVLRKLAKDAKDESLAKKVDNLHDLYCNIANTVTLRLLLNGAMATLGCDDKAEPT